MWPIAILPTENRTVRPLGFLQHPRSVEATVQRPCWNIPLLVQGILLLYFVTNVVFFLLYLSTTLGTMADCHFFYREPHCRPSNAAPTLAFWGAYAAGARERDGRLPGIGPSCKWGALKRLREGGYVREFARRARWPFAMRSAKAATRDGRLPGNGPRDGRLPGTGS